MTLKKLISLFTGICMTFCLACTPEVKPDNGDNGDGDNTGNEPNVEVPDVSSADVEYYNFAPQVKESQKYTVKVNGKYIKVFPTSEPHVSWFGVEDGATVKVEVGLPGENINEYVVRPVAKNYTAFKENGNVVILLKKYDRVSVELNGNITNPLFIFANPIDKVKPSKDNPSIKYFEAGKIYDEGPIVLSESCKEVYFEPGTYVKGSLYGNGLSWVKVHGGGFLNSEGYVGRAPSGTKPSLYQPFSVSLVNCPGAELDDYTHLLAEGGSGSFFTNCNNSTITNIKTICTEELVDGVLVKTNNDSMDIIGGTNFNVKHCFLYGHDDCYCIKSQKEYVKGKVDGMYFEDCIGWNVYSGNTFEIGYETGYYEGKDVTPGVTVQNVQYKDIYAIHSGTGKDGTEMRRAAFSIHHGAPGTIKNITYTNAYAEDVRENVVYLSCLSHNYNFGYDESGNRLKYSPGIIDGVTFTNLTVLSVRSGRGKSEIYGYDSSHKVKNVTFKNFDYMGRKITSLDDTIFSRKSNYEKIKFN